jgi:hypothetical protein
MVIKVNFHVSWVFIFFKVNGVGDKRSGNTTTLDVQTLLEALLNMSVRPACFIDKAFFSS